MTDLRKHLSSQNITQAAFADMLGISRGYLSEILSGEKTPGLELAVRIETATEGQVTARSWIVPSEAQK